MMEPVMPERIARLPRRGTLPIPWFAAQIDGRHDLRVADHLKRVRAALERRCFVCGEKFDAAEPFVFVLGPASVQSRVARDLPCHEQCADYAARACPFLASPDAARREDGLPNGLGHGPGEKAADSPGQCALFYCHAYRLFGGEDFLIALPAPEKLVWYRAGAPARSNYKINESPRP